MELTRLRLYLAGWAAVRLAGPGKQVKVRPASRAAWLLLGCALPGVCQSGMPSADALVRRVVATELKASQQDHSRWRYRDDEQVKRTSSIVVQTDAGSVKRLIARDGKPISAAEAADVEAGLQAFVHDPAKLEKQRKDGAADDQSATELLRMMPDAFVWTVAGTNGSQIILHFMPRPTFRPPDMEARVMGAMSGQIVMDPKQDRMLTLSGTLGQDVTIGFGLLGRLKQGGTFRVERREIKPGLWQITETHVHIDGKALLFKTIGQQQDEIQTDWTQVPQGTTLQQALVLSTQLK